ncbi:MAG: hypothetical protein LBT83_04045 [Tannerella sp.]|jgi:hypothetical protein|nr:hypothetical protein [Tannerella sp.]
MDIRIGKYSRVLPGKAWLNGEVYLENPLCDGLTFLTEMYNRLGIDYRKFFKMDRLSKLGFLAAELLMDGFDPEQPNEDTGIVLFNRSSSLDTDGQFQQTILRDGEHYFPSPALFVYTLPNIVTGELAIRHKIHGETAFYVLPHFRGELPAEIIRATLSSAGLRYLLAGWTEAYRDDTEAFMMLCEAGGDANDGSLPLTPENVERICPDWKQEK